LGRRIVVTLLHNSKNEIVMSIKKQFVKTKPVCKVTFSVEAKKANTASVVGDFNNWDQEAGALNKLKKYVVDGQFVNEPEADSFRWNDYAGAENSVLSI
jgi:1,4-alpha-glucan branching enzyme